MKFLFIIFLIFMSLPAFSDTASDVVGKWIYSGSVCRNESLDYRTHRSKAPSGENSVTEATFIFKSDGSASMDATFDDGERHQGVGSYSLEGNQIIIPELQDAELRLIQNRIVIKDLTGENQSVCRTREVFVFILSKLD